ncbi:hypothetical protein F3Y22_tig00111881pilonHSYRG00104 [Hibiscus syriacus]|uniref:Uncharacterized protein n=1 Tax=Hibiscus syriacus TaxID=106335 RepID=A0A6A2Y6G5_HIBSY|nr:hypothetical protein F3Y22_tig00111881pilonHSYRG00104 [Hibiscus syriacus]
MRRSKIFYLRPLAFRRRKEALMIAVPSGTSGFYRPRRSLSRTGHKSGFRGGWNALGNDDGRVAQECRQLDVGPPGRGSSWPSGIIRGGWMIFQDDFIDIYSSSDTEEILNSDSDEEKLTDFICAAQMAKVADTLLLLGKKLLDEDNHEVHLPNPMIGFGILTEPDQITQRTLPEDAIESPYLYYDNVVVASVGVWTKTSQYLYDVEPEFVDLKHFCTAV